ncbi:MAG: biopolymer transporter ExbD, partial [Nitrospinae bacterium]|nr:biopolymer transporter ExbD [Nitrospinota bacterium]
MLNIGKGNHKRFKPDLAPLIDVVFLLLIFYMLTFAIPGQGLDIKLPPDSTPVEKIDEPLSVKMLSASEFLVGGEKTDLKGLEGLLRIEIKKRKLKTVVIHADEEAKYESFALVLD